ncbi:hypothetical protein IG631_12602 [Alternaria alternata]|nr:hypothetical protein IG631_12602 [Alternaria alternata]
MGWDRSSGEEMLGRAGGNGHVLGFVGAHSVLDLPDVPRVEMTYGCGSVLPSLHGTPAPIEAVSTSTAASIRPATSERQLRPTYMVSLVLPSEVMRPHDNHCPLCFSQTSSSALMPAVAQLHRAFKHFNAASHIVATSSFVNIKTCFYLRRHDSGILPVTKKLQASFARLTISCCLNTLTILQHVLPRHSSTFIAHYQTKKKKCRRSIGSETNDLIALCCKFQETIITGRDYNCL